MSKNKICNKKLLLILSMCITTIFTAALIIMAMVPYAATPYSYISENGKLKTEYVFKQNVYEQYINDSELPLTVAYKLHKGQLTETNTGLPIGEIDAYKLVIGDTIFTNTLTQTLKIVSIIGVSLGAAGFLAYFILNNKKDSGLSTKKSSKKR